MFTLFLYVALLKPELFFFKYEIYDSRDTWASLVAQAVKNLPAMWETWVRSQGWEDSLEEGMASHSSILAWRIPIDRGAWRAKVHGVTKSQTHNWAAKHSNAIKDGLQGDEPSQVKDNEDWTTQQQQKWRRGARLQKFLDCGGWGKETNKALSRFLSCIIE